MTDVIDTRELAASERYDAAYEAIAANLARVDMEFPEERGLVLRGALTHLGDIGHSRVDSNVTRVHRTPNASRDVLPPSIFLGFQNAGRTQIEQGGRRAELRPGTLVLWETTTPYTLLDQAGMRHHYFRVSTDALGLPHEIVRAATAQPLTPDHPVADLALAFYQRLAARPDAFSRKDAEALSQPSIEMIRALITTHLGAEHLAKDPLHATLRLRILEYARANLGDPQLSGQQIAAQQNISVRQLYKVLAEGDITLGDWIRRHRLERCRAELARPDARSTTIEVIAHRWGFQNPSSFSRHFRAAYGMTPREWRDNPRNP